MIIISIRANENFEYENANFQSFNFFFLKFQLFCSVKGKTATKYFNQFMHGDIPLLTFIPLIQLPKTKHDLLFFHNDSCKSTNV